jgi:hypothetical protein
LARAVFEDIAMNEATNQGGGAVGYSSLDDDPHRTDEEKTRIVIMEYLRALRDWRKEIIFTVDGYVIARTVIGLFDQNPADQDTQPSPIYPTEFVNAPVDAETWEYWNSRQLTAPAAPGDAGSAPDAESLGAERETLPKNLVADPHPGARFEMKDGGVFGPLVRTGQFAGHVFAYGAAPVMVAADTILGRPFATTENALRRATGKEPLDADDLKRQVGNVAGALIPLGGSLAKIGRSGEGAAAELNAVAPNIEVGAANRGLIFEGENLGGPSAGQVAARNFEAPIEGDAGTIEGKSGGEEGGPDTVEGEVDITGGGTVTVENSSYTVERDSNAIEGDASTISGESSAAAIESDTIEGGDHTIKCETDITEGGPGTDPSASEEAAGTNLDRPSEQTEEMPRGADDGKEQAFDAVDGPLPAEREPGIAPNTVAELKTEAATVADAANVPQAVLDNQAAQDTLFANQQKQIQAAIDEGGASAKGAVFTAQGAEAEAITGRTLNQLSDATVNTSVDVAESGVGKQVDFTVTRGNNTAYVESKYSISTIYDRTVNQLTNAVEAADPNDLVILQVARTPTAGEITNLQNALGQTTSGADVFSRIQIVSKQTDLYNILNAGLH